MIIFQNKIIYMPSIPPFSRSEKIADYTYPKPVSWRQEHIKSLDGTKLALAVGTTGIHSERACTDVPTTIIAYFQGNASSLPPRLPGLSTVLADLHRRSGNKRRFILVALSYRGFWTSKDRPSQHGIEQDSQAFLEWLQAFSKTQARSVHLICWGQSIGAGVAASATASWLRSDSATDHYAPINGLILETPFTTMKDMLIAMYPQKWLPYRYLWPFLRSTWNNYAAMDSIAEQSAQLRPDVLIMQAGRDELIPPGHSTRLHEHCKELGIGVRWLSIPGAYHTTAANLASGRQAIVNFVEAQAARIESKNGTESEHRHWGQR